MGSPGITSDATTSGLEAGSLMKAKGVQLKRIHFVHVCVHACMPVRPSPAELLFLHFFPASFETGFHSVAWADFHVTVLIFPPQHPESCDHLLLVSVFQSTVVPEFVLRLLLPMIKIWLVKGTPEQRGLPPRPRIRHKPHPNTCFHREIVY